MTNLLLRFLSNLALTKKEKKLRDNGRRKSFWSCHLDNQSSYFPLAKLLGGEEEEIINLAIFSSQNSFEEKKRKINLRPNCLGEKERKMKTGTNSCSAPAAVPQL